MTELLASPQGFSPTSATSRHTPATMPPNPSPTYERLRHYIAKLMRMSPVDQPLMLLELLGQGFARQQPARPQRRTSPGGSWGRT